MKIRRFKIMVLGPFLLSLPMMCIHSGDGHHTGSHHSVPPQQLQQSLTHDHMSKSMKVVFLERNE